MDDPRISTGYAQTNRLTIDEFTKRNHECICFSFNGPRIEGNYNGSKIIPHKSTKESNENENLYGDKDFLISKYIKEKPDLLFFHNDFYRQDWFLSLPEEIKKKSVWWIPLDILRKNHGYNFNYLKEIPHMYFVTNHAKEITKIDAKIIPHAIHRDFFKPLKEKNKEYTICRIDRHQPRKQWPYAIHAYSFFAKNKNVKFLAKCNPKDSAGIDPDTKDFIDLEEFRDRVNLDKNKIQYFQNSMSIDDMIDQIYDPSHFFITTSGSEGFGLGIVESMARGCIPIYPNDSSFPEVTGKLGYPYPFGGYRICSYMNTEYGWPNVNTIHQTLEQTYKDFNNLKDISLKCRKHVENNFHPNIVYDLWEKEIKKITNDEINLNIKYSIIIVSKNYFDLLVNCIRSIKKYTKEIYEIIIVNNCSDKENSELYDEYAKNNNIKIIHNHTEGGFTYANNLGIQKAIGEYIVLLNNDTEIINDKWLSIPTKQLNDNNADIIGPSTCWFNLGKHVPNKLKNIAYQKDNNYYCNFTGFWFVIGTKKIFDQYKLNENIKSYLGDDVDYCLNLQINNKKWISISGKHENAEGLVKHINQKSIKTFMNNDYYHKGLQEFFNEWSEKITIVIPTRNREKYLIDLLKSIQEQTYQNWELIICNDGNTFSTETENIIKNINKVKIIYGIQQGPMYAHELLYRNSNSEWIFRVDDDNILDKNCLYELIDNIDNDIGAIAPLVLSPYKKEIEQTNYETPIDINIHNFMSAAIVQQHIWPNYSNLIYAQHLHSSFLYRKSLAERIKFIYHTSNSSVSYGEETIFSYKIYKLGYKLLVNQKAKIFHYMAENGGTRDKGMAIYYQEQKNDFELFEKTIKEIQ